MSINVNSLRYVPIALLLLALGIVFLFRVWHGRETHDRVPAGGEAAPFTETPEQAAAAWHERGLSYAEDREYRLAIDAFTEAIRLGGPHAPSYYERARCYYMLEEYDKALPDYTEIIRIGEHDWMTYTLRAQCHYRLGAAEAAYKDYTEAIRLDPDNGELHHLYRSRAFAARDHNKALADFAEAIHLRADDAETYYLRGEFYRVKLDNSEKAIEDYTKAIELNPTNARYFECRGLALMWVGSAQDVIADFSKAIELNPEISSEIIRYRAFEYKVIGDLAGAIADYTTLIQRDPEDFDSYLGRATAWMEKGRFDKAIPDFHEAARIGCHYVSLPAHRGLAEAYLHNGDFDEAVEQSTRALAIWPNEPDISMVRGHAHVEMGCLEAALSDYTAAAMTGWRMAEALDCRGRVYERLGDKESAEEDFAEAKRLRDEGGFH